MLYMRLIVNGEALSFPREMVGAHAAVLACKHLQLDPGELRLRRPDGSFVGDAMPVGDVLADGDELELASLSG
jgi:hypothetical protein